MVDVLVRLDSLINAKHATTKHVRGRNTFYPEVLHVELQEYHLQDLGQRLKVIKCNGPYK